MQEIIDNYKKLTKVNDISNKDILLVCGKALSNSFIYKYLNECNSNIHTFSDFSPNPKYEEMLEGIKILKKYNCKIIIAIGGGSAIDAAKTIKAFSNMDSSKNYLEQKIVNNNIKLIAIPTTAGTGSESTHFAVIYYNNKKYSVADKTLLPDYVLLEPKLLETLPLYQKKSTMLDALCQGIESYWSVNSNDESKKYAKQAIKLILENYKRYINEDKSVYEKILKAANYSGRAINISKTTAPHAMSYKITSLYNISHGHAVAICLPYVWEYMINNLELITDVRGKEYLENIFCDLDNMFETNSHIETIEKLKNIYSEIGIKYTNIVKEKDLKELVFSANVERLNNNPIKLSKDTIKKIYRKLL